MTETAASSLADKAGKYLSFQLAEEEYGLEILKVKEIIGMMNITQLPRTPDFVKGVINLRGKVIPVIDLRLKFSLPEKEVTEKTCVIVVEVTTGDINVQIGVVVDEVLEVLNVGTEELEETPKFSVSVDTEFIKKKKKSGEKVKTLLDINNVLISKEIDMLAESAS